VRGWSIPNLKRLLAFTLAWFIVTTVIYWGTAERFTIVEGWNWRAIFMGYLISPIITLITSYLYFWTKNKSEYVKNPQVPYAVIVDRTPKKEGGETA
jgi:hypothetical protein